MKIYYEKVADYLLPLLKLKDRKQKNISKYGKMRLEYIKNYNKVLYTKLTMNNELNLYLYSIDKKCNEELDKLINYFKIKENITENLKETDQMEWVGKMGNIKNRAEEIILKEYIFE